MTYCKILIVHNTKIHAEDAENLLIRNLFGAWPLGNLAQIYTGEYRGSGQFCSAYYSIGYKDRTFGKLFYLLKRVGLSAVSGHSVGANVIVRPSLLKTISKTIINFIIDTGLWEWIFRVRLNNEIREFVLKFKPDIIYTQGYSVGLTRLALDISKLFNLPIFYFPVDDWHNSLYKNSLVKFEVNNLATSIAARSALRFALGNKMSKVLSKRYQLDFECLYHADDLGRFSVQRTIKSPSRKMIFGYFGSLYLGRSKCLDDLRQACESSDIEYEIHIYSSIVPSETRSSIINSRNIKFFPLPSHNDLPKALVNCDVLFLPESFEAKFKAAIELSVSTKCHLYMMSGCPILVYGPKWSGTVSYAKECGWGVVVDEQLQKNLIEGLREVLSLLPKYPSDAVLAIARSNHDISLLKNKVLQRITSVLENRKSRFNES